MNGKFQKALPVLTALEESGFQAYFVGGAVRDAIMQRTISDIDIATSATPEQVKSIFPRTVDVGIQHGTVIVIHQGTAYEVTTFRREGEYENFRKPLSVSFVDDLKEDLQRRDFTMNAIAMDRMGNYSDPFHGVEDIQQRRIRTVGEPMERFHEDALRMLRAFRFSSQLQFTIDEDTLRAIQNLKANLAFISVERKCQEFRKLMMGANRIQSLQQLQDIGLVEFLPGFQDELFQNAYPSSFPQEISAFSEESMWLWMIKSIEEKSLFLRSWKLPVKFIQERMEDVAWFGMMLQRPLDVYDMYLIQEETIQHVLPVLGLVIGTPMEKKQVELIHQKRNLRLQKRSELAISGNDILSLTSQKAGPWVETVLRAVEKAVLEGTVENQKEDLKEFILRETFI
jgi:tRNA nucleotidyltransferase (CCA-adding enzyme)